VKIAYFDCIVGASGDMILGALVDAGLPEDTLIRLPDRLHMPELKLRVQRVVKGSINATKVDVLVGADVPERRLAEIEAILDGSELQAHIQTKARGIFRRLAEVEAGIHGMPVEQVHLHELGGVDTVADVVGALVGLDALGIERVYVSPLPLGRGMIESAHGALPQPAPATLALLQGVPVMGSDLPYELVTPTGAAILTAIASGFGPIPPMTLSAVGYGAGGYDLPIPNVLRLLVGEQASAGAETVETLVLLETNIDDSNPEIYDYVVERLLAAGALDVFLAPIQMKKNRPATMLSVLCHPAEADALTAILYAETSTLGVRRLMLERRCVERSIETVQTSYGPLRVKVARLSTGQVKAAPEYEDCRRAAEVSKAPLREVYRAAEIAIASLIAPGNIP